jgi:NAD+ kinase
LKAIAIFYQGRKEATPEVADRLISFLKQQGYEVRVVDTRYEGEETPDPALRGYDLAVVLGGDGTILHAARICAFADIPIVGINFGRVGFLSELEPAELESHLPYYLDGEASVWLDKRAMLYAVLEQDGKSEEFLALNDIIIARGKWPRVVQVCIWIDDFFYNTTHADGVIVSTATGSTAYNMAVGGPLLHPQVQSTVLTPIAPHLALNRSLILPPEATVKLQIFTGLQNGVFSADGQMNREIQNGATITVRKSQFVTQFLRRRKPTQFYHIINAKLYNVDDEAPCH